RWVGFSGSSPRRSGSTAWKTAPSARLFFRLPVGFAPIPETRSESFVLSDGRATGPAFLSGCRPFCFREVSYSGGRSADPVRRRDGQGPRTRERRPRGRQG